MQTGFVAVGNDNQGVTKIGSADDFTAKEWIAANHDGVYFFSADESKDGSMKTGYQNIEMDDDTYQFYFQKNGEAKTQYDNKIKKFTVAGLILKPTADDDNNYGAVAADGKTITTAYKDMEIGMFLVNKQGTKVTSKTVKDENDQFWLTDKDGKILNKAASKDAYDDMKDDKKWYIAD